VGETFFWGKRKCHWWREVRMASNKQNWGKNSSNCVWKLSADCQEHSRTSEHRQRNRKILTEDLDMRKVCAKMVPKELTEKQKQRRVTICQDLLERQDDIWAMSSQVMKHGSTNMTLKWSSQVHNGRLLIPHDQQNSVSPNQESKQCCQLFLILEGLFNMNLYQLDKQSTKFIIWKYWEGCMKKLDGNDPNFLATTHGSCITTMHLLTRHCLSGSF